MDITSATDGSLLCCANWGARKIWVGIFQLSTSWYPILDEVHKKTQRQYMVYIRCTKYCPCRLPFRHSFFIYRVLLWIMKDLFSWTIRGYLVSRKADFWETFFLGNKLPDLLTIWETCNPPCQIPKLFRQVVQVIFIFLLKSRICFHLWQWHYVVFVCRIFLYMSWYLQRII